MQCLNKRKCLNSCYSKQYCRNLLHLARQFVSMLPLPGITHTTTGASGITDDGLPGANGLPPGLSATYLSNTITISGTPTQAGTFNYSIPLTGGCGTVSATGQLLLIACPLLPLSQPRKLYVQVRRSHFH